MRAIAWISGASGGTGKALVQTVPFDDARVIGVSRSEPPAPAEHLDVDLADPSSWETVAESFRKAKRQKFVDAKEEGKLTDPEEVAWRLPDLLHAGFDNGTVADLRKLDEAKDG